MATYMPLIWKETNIRVFTKPTGLQKWIHIPYIIRYPYFSGTFVQFDLEVHNNSGEIQNIDYTSLLFRLSANTRETADNIANVDGSLEVNPHSKSTQRVQLEHLPQPGNYSHKLLLRNTQGHATDGDTVYFDALPKDSTSFTAGIVIIASVISLLIGLVIGGLGNG